MGVVWFGIEKNPSPLFSYCLFLGIILIVGVICMCYDLERGVESVGWWLLCDHVDDEGSKVKLKHHN
ncbi:hypothetical protein BDV29DRAFT_184128, partial [Aspergillus leporis]